MLVSLQAKSADPVAITRVITISLLDEWRETQGATADELAVLNVLRLLETYKNDTFYVSDPLGILERDDIEHLSPRHRPHDLSQLKRAIELTREAHWPDASRAEFVSLIHDILMRYIEFDNPKFHAAPSHDEFQLVELFLSTLTDNLSNA